MNSRAETFVVLAADIGGTFARFRPMRGQQTLGNVLVLKRASAEDLPDLCARAKREFGMNIDGAAIAIAAPVTQGRARMTNAQWNVDEQGIAQALATERVLLINDFAALALSLPMLRSADTLTIPPRHVAGTSRGATPSQPLSVVFGPGTGLGVAALANLGGCDIPMASEGGHISFAPTTPFEQKVLEHAATEFERVSWERILSGSGLELLDQVSRREQGMDSTRRDAAQIIAAAQDGTCAAASRSIRCFAELIGSFGGDLALMFNAGGGVFIGGGIVARIAPLISLPSVRDRFCHKGRFSSWLAALPLAIVTNHDATLNGAARAFAERFAGRPDDSAQGTA
jgi:glucokinase